MLRHTIELIMVFGLAALVAPLRVHAYLDPGTGSYLIQMAVASLAGVGYFVRLNWKKIKTKYFNKANGDDEKTNKDK